MKKPILALVVAVFLSGSVWAYTSYSNYVSNDDQHHADGTSLASDKNGDHGRRDHDHPNWPPAMDDGDCDDGAYKCPPDPGKAGNRTIAGIDANRNGVRDDVERYIIRHFSYSQKAVAALMQLAKAYQRVLLTSTDANSAYNNALGVNRALDCILYVFADKPNKFDVSDIIGAEQMNTKDRFTAYVAYEKLIGGRFFPLGKSDSSACDANVDAMRN